MTRRCTSSCPDGRRPGAAERRQRLRPPGLRRARRARLVGARARRARRLAAARRGGVRRPGRRRSRRCPTAPSCCSTGWSPRGARTCSCRRPAGCGWSSWCTCRWATTPTDDDARAREGAVLAAAAAVVTTSDWSGARLLRAVRAARPTGCTSPRPASTPPPRARDGDRRCAALRRGGHPGKGQDVLVDALAALTGPAVELRAASAAWTATRRTPRGCAAAPGTRGLGDRVRFAGPRTGADLAAQLRRRRPARAGLARRDVRHGGHRGAGPRHPGRRGRGRRRAGGARARRRRDRPGLLVPPDDPAALAAALRRWLGDADLRRRLRRAARERRASLPAWAATTPSVRRRPGRGGAMTVEGIRVSRRRGSSCASRPTPPPVAATSSSTLRRHLPARGRRVIHDLGCGTGSMGRWLAPRLPGPQHWVLHDRDADLLRARRRRRPARPPTARRSPSRPGGPTSPGCAGRPRRRDLSPPRRCSTCSPPDELDGLVAACAGAGCPALLTLSVVGRVELTPPTRWTPESPRRSTPTSAARPRAAACSARTPSTAAVEAFARRGRRGRCPAEPVAARRRRGRAGGGVAQRLGRRRRASSSRSWPAAPAPYAAPAPGAGPRPGGSPSRWTTPTCWSCLTTSPERRVPVPSIGRRRDRARCRTVGWARLAGAAAILAVLVWRLGTGPFLDGVRTVDGPARWRPRRASAR